jgi:hypothetical protein
MKKANLNDKDHQAMDLMLGRVLDAYKNGTISKASAVGGLAHIMAALDQGNTSEATGWFNQEGLSYFEE